MNKLQQIQQICKEASEDYKELMEVGEIGSSYELEQGRSELAEEILEILNGESK